MLYVHTYTGFDMFDILLLYQNKAVKYKGKSHLLPYT